MESWPKGKETIDVMKYKFYAFNHRTNSNVLDEEIFVYIYDLVRICL